MQKQGQERAVSYVKNIDMGSVDRNGGKSYKSAAKKPKLEKRQLLITDLLSTSKKGKQKMVNESDLERKANEIVVINDEEPSLSLIVPGNKSSADSALTGEQNTADAIQEQQFQIVYQSTRGKETAMVPFNMPILIKTTETKCTKISDSKKQVKYVFCSGREASEGADISDSDFILYMKDLIKNNDLNESNTKILSNKHSTIGKLPYFRYRNDLSPLINSMFYVKAEAEGMTRSKGFWTRIVKFETVEEQKLLHLIFDGNYSNKIDRVYVKQGVKVSVSISDIQATEGYLRKKLRLCEDIAHCIYHLEEYKINPAMVVYYLLSGYESMEKSRLDDLPAYNKAKTVRKIVLGAYMDEKLRKLRNSNTSIAPVVEALDEYHLLDPTVTTLPEKVLLGKLEVDNCILAAATDLIGSGKHIPSLSFSENVPLMQQLARLLSKRGLLAYCESAPPGEFRLRAIGEIVDAMKSSYKKSIESERNHKGFSSPLDIVPV